MESQEKDRKNIIVDDDDEYIDEDDDECIDEDHDEYIYHEELIKYLDEIKDVLLSFKKISYDKLILSKLDELD